MTTLVQLMSGRKKESSVWEYFVFDEEIKKSKNTSNLKLHLKSKHAPVSNFVESVDREKQQIKTPASQEQKGKSCVTVSNAKHEKNNIKSFFSNMSQWSGKEHDKRVEAVMKMMVHYSRYHAVDLEVLSETTNTKVDNVVPQAKRFKFVAEKILNQNQVSATKTSTSIQQQLNQYMEYVKSIKFDSIDNIFNFWTSRETEYSLLAPVALDLLSAPASQAYVERIFSVCQMLTSGKRNKLGTMLATRVYLKLNMPLIEQFT
ncbi:hypothetical protein HELRODRAFT_178719 [Helobdella robusta]|uniref:HAT C-terminal dimerisation domain-containing protein n=1 Tax=Helobdella robusta TaxID=6412 RepID=T1FDM5_HELRO|nr:hypothetical protein HELRODRAFT_178719 [Helobdella robusta]ESN96919.1 hypothetical protein HELRODRAFT_178719 [Helobdella robusta]